MVSSTRCFRLFIAYVGDGFSGFQEQKNARTVEGELKHALAKITKNPFKINTAGRTDAGVHAFGQVVSLEYETKLSIRQLTLALASLLPKDLAVWRIDEMPLGFDARRHSIGKLYVYRIHQGLVADPFWHNRALHIRQKLDVTSMDQAAQFFVGEHDFSSFRGSLCTAIHARRCIWHMKVLERGPLVTVEVRGNAFCLNMVRIMVGTLIEVGRGKRKPESVKAALLGRDRNLAGITAKALGLNLERVFYPDEINDANLPEHVSFPRYPITKESWPFLEHEIVYGART